MKEGNIQSKNEKAIDLEGVHTAETQLADVMELTDARTVEEKLKEVEAQYASDPSELNSIRLGIIHHEVALNLGFLHGSTYTGYATRSYDRLTELEGSIREPGYLPFVASYRASALALMGGETQKLSLVGESFRLFETAVERFSHLSCLPEFLRGSVAENLPWIFWRKKKFAAKDFASIIRKYEADNSYANAKLMSFTYWAWAKAHSGSRYRAQALTYLRNAVALDPHAVGGRMKAEALLKEWASV